MKGIVLAGGTGSRLFPLTKVTNKHLLPVGEKPMIFYPIEKLIGAGITDILVVTGIEHMGDVISLLGSGVEFGCEFTYRVQDQPGGIAQALGLAKGFVGTDKMVVILGDNLFEDSLEPYVKQFEAQAEGAMLLLKEVSDPHRFGVAVLEQEKLIEIEEKPSHPKSSMAVTGIYFYDAKVFSYIADCIPSKRGELEISDVNNHYITHARCETANFTGWWTDAGTFDSLKRASELVASAA